ncbi:MAG: DsbA family protein, partial [Verrucomicrobiota bacterium]|nr:DsbA family protein [Verrucomicrobiota bacterium]
MAPQRYLPFVIIGVVAVTAATAGTLIYRTKHARVASLAAQTAADNRGGKPGASPTHAQGPEVAPVTIEEFGDFQCPPCSALAATLRTFEHDYPGKLRVIFREYPLDMHNHARLAALGAEAAGLQGKFWEMHEQLYTKQNDWSKEEDFRPMLNRYAAAIGLDSARFAKDLESDKTQSRLKLDRERATSLGVNATPTVFINGQLVPPNLRTTEGLRTAIQ